MPISKHYDKLFTEEQLKREYQDKSVCDIAKQYNIPQTCMYRIFQKFRINRRSGNFKGNISGATKHGKCSRIHRKSCEICGKELSINPNAKHCIKCHNYLNSINKVRLKKMSKIIKEGWENRNFAKLLHSKKIKYKGIWMRSSWEIKYAKYLDKNNIKWLYESKTFDLGNTTYTPDFYLPEFNLYIEVKGWWRDDAKKKFEEFKQRYCGERIKVLDKQELKLGEVL